MTNQKKLANISRFYVWLESMAKGNDRVAIQAQDAMATGSRLPVIPIPATHVAVNSISIGLPGGAANDPGC